MQARAARIILVFLAVLIVWPAGAARAHGAIATSEPGDGQTVLVSPTEIVVTMTEDVAGAARLSLDGPSGSIPTGTLQIDGRILRVSIDPLEPGTYVATWSAIGTDGHATSGDFSFGVGTSINDVASPAGAGLVDIGRDAWPRMLLVAGAMLWGGALVLARFVFKDSWDSPGVGTGALLGKASLFFGEVVMLASLVGSGLPVLDPDFLLRTTPGLLLSGRLLVATVALAIPLRTRLTLNANLVLWLAFVLFLAMSGHASTAPMGSLPAVALDLSHLLWSAAWAGGLLLLGLVPHRIGSPQDLSNSLRRFSRIALVSVLALALTGAIGAQQQTERATDLTGTLYGRILVTKLLLFAGLIGLGALMRFRVLPRLIQGGKSRSVSRLLRVEAILAVGIIACVALMTSMPTPSSAISAAPPTQGRGIVLAEVEGMQMAIAPGRPGLNTMWVSDGEAQVTLLDANANARELSFTPAASGAVTTVDLAPGPWSAEVTTPKGAGLVDFEVTDAARDAEQIELPLALGDPATDRCLHEISGYLLALQVDGIETDVRLDAGSEQGGCLPSAADRGPSEARVLALIASDVLGGKRALILREKGEPWASQQHAFARRFRATGGVVSTAIAGQVNDPPAADTLIMFGSPEVIAPAAKDLAASWTPDRWAIAGSTLFGSELADALSDWRDRGILTFAGGMEHESIEISDYLLSSVERWPLETPSIEAFMSYLSLQGTGDPEQIALFQVSPQVNFMSTMGHGHTEGGLLYSAGDFIRYTDFYALGR